MDHLRKGQFDAQPDHVSEGVQSVVTIGSGRAGGPVSSLGCASARADLSEKAAYVGAPYIF